MQFLLDTGRSLQRVSRQQLQRSIVVIEHPSRANIGKTEQKTQTQADSPRLKKTGFLI